MTNCCAPRWGHTTGFSVFYHPSIHQIPTLEKTKLCQRPILSSLLSACFQRIGGGGLARDLCHGKQRVSPLHHISQLAYSEDWLSQLLFTGLSDAEDDRSEGALAIKFIIGLDFAVTVSSPVSSFVLFDTASEQSVELKWLILHKYNKWFHSSRVKFPLVSMSASWFLVSMYLIWIFGSKLIRSNNQSRATLWVLETCLIVGLLPLIIILITASLSSNTYNKASWCENWTFEGTESMSLITSIFFWGLWRLWTSLSSCPDRSETLEIFPRTETIRTHSSRAGKPSNLSPVSNEMISDSVELWETEVCFLPNQLIGTNVWLPKVHNVPPEVDFESSRSPAKSESWNSPSLHCLAVLPTWQYCLYSHVWWIFEINRLLNQRYTTKLPDEKIGRLRKQGQHFSNHWTFLKIACVCESCEVEDKLHVCSTTGLTVLYGSESCFQELQRSDPRIQDQSFVQRDDFGLCWTVWNWGLSLAHPTYWNICMTSKNAQCSSRSGFWILKISRNIRVLK